VLKQHESRYGASGVKTKCHIVVYFPMLCKVVGCVTVGSMNPRLQVEERCEISKEYGNHPLY
jgi:hypothetical protein